MYRSIAVYSDIAISEYTDDGSTDLMVYRPYAVSLRATVVQWRSSWKQLRLQMSQLPPLSAGLQVPMDNYSSKYTS